MKCAFEYELVVKGEEVMKAELKHSHAKSIRTHFTTYFLPIQFLAPTLNGCNTSL